MSEARNVIILILVLLFIFVGVGVAISRLNKNAKPSNNPNQQGILQQIFGNQPTATPSAAVKPVASAPTTTPKMVVVTQESSSDQVYSFEGMPTNAPQKAPAVKVTPAVVAQNQETKGGNPKEIPSTGANPAVILFALLGLGSGLYLHRKA